VRFRVLLSAIYQHVTKKKIVVDMRFKTTF
jgi:hypothetical protein